MVWLSRMNGARLLRLTLEREWGGGGNENHNCYFFKVEKSRGVFSPDICEIIVVVDIK